MKAISFIFLLILLVCTTSCKKSPPVAPPVDTTQPGSRNYTWTVDTIRQGPYDFIDLISIWGSSPSDVWAVGGADVSYNTIWHYDGTGWSRDSVFAAGNLQTVYGFAPDNIWAASSPGDGAFHFNGSNWTTIGNLVLPGYPVSYLNDIWGDGPTNIYFIGAAANPSNNTAEGVILHFDGQNWTFVPVSNTNQLSFIRIRKDTQSNVYFLEGWNFNGGDDISSIFTFDGQNIKQIYQTMDLTTINTINGKVYITSGKKVYTFVNNQLQVWKDFSGTLFADETWGRSEKDFFCVSTDGISHYNGTDLKTLFPTTTLPSSAVIFPNDVFFVGYGSGGSIVIHGILNK